MNDLLGRERNVPRKTFEGSIEIDGERFSCKGMDVGHIEILFLLGKSLSTRHAYQSCRREDIIISCGEMKKRYNPKMVAEFGLSHFTMNPAQYSKGGEQFQPGPAPQKTFLSQLLSLHDSLGSQENMRSELIRFIQRISKREAFIGTPREETPALQVFYDQIELHLLHTIHTLIQKNDPAITRSVLKEFALAASRCGGRYYAVTLEQYLLVCHGRQKTPTSKLYTSLAEYRAVCLQNAVIANSSNEVHNYTRALRAIGKKYGIPGYRQALLFDDPYVGPNYSIQRIEKGFLELYTVPNLILDWILPLLREDGDFRSLYIDWHKENMPDWWEKEKFETILKDLERIEKSTPIPQQQERIKSLLEEHEIIVEGNQSVRDAIRAERISSYLEQFVYSEDLSSLTLQGVIYCLERIGAIASPLKWQDKKKTVIPLELHENTLYRQVTGFFSMISSNISNAMGFFFGV